MPRAKHAARSEVEAKNGADEAGARTPPRGLWSGSISFGLLQIPVMLYTAEQRSQEIHFHLLDKNDLSRVRYERVNTQTGKPVEWKDIVKGYEIEPDNYVVIDPEELEKANVKATQTIDIQDFVPADQIEPEFFATPYYLVPALRAKKAYVLLREALERKEAVAIATFVLRTREHLVAIMPVGDALMLEILRFGHELRRAEDIPIPHETTKDAAIADRELAMAEQLIEGMMSDWQPDKYKDRYHADVLELIEEKARTGTTRAHHTRTTGAVATDVVDLLDLLKKSVAAQGKGGEAATNDAAGAKGGPRKARAKGARGRRKTEAA